MDAFPFHVTVIRTSRKRSASIRLADGKVTLRVPDTLSDKQIKDLILKKMRWIKQKLKTLSARPTPKQYASGERFAYLGKQYTLKRINGPVPSIKLTHGCFEATVRESAGNSKAIIRSLLIDWYQSHAEKYLIDKTQRFAKQIGVTPHSITVKHYKSRWGSCSVHGDIAYNWQIILAPHWIVDYVVVHELCHILEHNHSSHYWKHVERYSPNWRECRQWLTDNSNNLDAVNG